VATVLVIGAIPKSRVGILLGWAMEHLAKED
jgi:hypothetical protein